jgi:hypothetical protein
VRRGGGRVEEAPTEPNTRRTPGPGAGGGGGPRGDPRGSSGFGIIFFEKIRGYGYVGIFGLHSGFFYHQGSGSSVAHAVMGEKNSESFALKNNKSGLRKEKLIQNKNKNKIMSESFEIDF